MAFWKFLACVMVILISLPSYGKVTKYRSSNSSEFDETSSDGFYFSLGSKIIFAKMGTEDGTTFESRNLSVLGAEAILGYEVSHTIIGLGVDFNLWQQQTKVEDVGNTNLAGYQTQIGAVFGYRWSPIVFIGKYFFLSGYQMSKAGSNGLKATYLGPTGNFAIQILYGWTTSSHIGVEYYSGQYKKQEGGSTEVTLSDDAKLNFNGVGVVYVFIF